jgi:hypothetical protein
MACTICLFLAAPTLRWSDPNPAPAPPPRRPPRSSCPPLHQFEEEFEKEIKVVVVGPDRYRSPRHTVTCKTRTKGSSALARQALLDIATS